ncbi:MAG: DUF4270 domain-containing protein [Muribaculaceae bacterium]|nr:DUF4270 domain-containing protein [Muribaculaceae bacterium]
MKKHFPAAAAAALTLLGAMTACDDSVTTGMPGGSMVADRFDVVIDSSFTVTARSILNPKVQSRTTTQLLGAIKAPEFGTLRADYVAQLFPSNSIDTVGVTPERIDSVKLQLVFDKGGFVGDSLAPIGFEVYPLTRRLPYPIYSDFNPDGYYSSTPMGSGMFTAAGISVSDTVAGSSYRYAYAKLPRQFGVELFKKFKQDSQLFNNPEAFADYFPGIYVKQVYGSGRVTRITDTRLLLYYTKQRRLPNKDGVEVDSITSHFAYYMATAPEVVSNTCIDLQISEKINQMAAEGRAVMLSPAGRDVELTFPIREVIDYYRNKTQSALSVINTMSFKLPFDSIANGRGIYPSTYVLMVLSKDKDKFFAANKLPDDVTSFVGTVNASTMTYTFNDMRQYLIDMIAKDDAGELTPEDYTFTLTPVSMVMENSTSSYYGYTTSQTLSGMSPMIAMPSMAEFLPKKAKVTLTFSKQQLK